MSVRVMRKRRQQVIGCNVESMRASHMKVYFVSLHCPALLVRDELGVGLSSISG